MSGRFPKCLTPGCRRLLIRKTSSQHLTCGGCQQTFEVADLVNAEQNASPEGTTSDVLYLKQSNMSPSEVDDVNQKHPNVLESLRGYNRNSSASSVGSEGSTRRPSSYNVSVSSRSISSEEGGSTISRNTRAVSRRTHRRELSTASTDESVSEVQIRDGYLRYDSNYEEEKISETNYPLNESKINQQAGRVRGRIISEEEIEESEQDSAFNGNSSYERGRDLNSSIDETASFRNRGIPLGYKSKTEQEVEETKPVLYETNYPSKPPKINLNTKRDSIDDNSSMRNSIISEEDIEERAYPRGRNSNASFDGSTSSRSFSSDEGGSRRGVGEARFSSKRTHRSHGSSSDSTYDTAYSVSQLSRVQKQNIPNQQNELIDLVIELEKMGITREKLIILLLKQTETGIKEKSMHQDCNTRSLVRKLSVQIPPPEFSDSGSNRGRRRPAKHNCRPVFGGTPFVTCRSCLMLLQLPIGMPTHKFIKIRCGECSESNVYPFPAKDTTYNPLHKALGYESARFLMVPSRQFSLTDDDM